tara:strand:- start:782 stop:1066 length:285 start_codon:yes stop_codon:yes gene_type:complete
MNEPKHVPIRTCIGCGIKRPQKDFVKLVKTKENLIRINSNDNKRNLEGRSVYICKSYECWTNTIKKEKIERNMKSTLSKNDKDIICDYMIKYRL